LDDFRKNLGISTESPDAMMYSLAQSGGQGTPPLVSEENYLELAGQLEFCFFFNGHVAWETLQ
jgi:hypothetical protein